MLIMLHANYDASIIKINNSLNVNKSQQVAKEDYLSINKLDTNELLALMLFLFLVNSPRSKKFLKRSSNTMQLYLFSFNNSDIKIYIIEIVFAVLSSY